jgi:hypothetical protein
MKQPFGRRALGFEQMEERLALSTTTGDYLSSIVLLDNAQGGLTFLGSNQVLSSGNFAEYAVDGDSEFLILNRYLPSNHIRNNIVPSGDTGSYQEGLSDQVAPIAQPDWEDEELAHGIISLTEVFAPATQTKASQGTHSEFVAISNPQVTPQTTTPVSAMMELSLSRGRDVYFEVAALKECEKTSSNAASEDEPQEIIPAIFAEPAARDAVFEDSTPNRPGEASARQRHAPKVPQNVPVDAVGLEAEIPPNEQSKQDQAAAASAESVEDTVYDQVFADWHRVDSLVETAIPLRNEEGKEHRAAWPVVVALAGAGLIARSRRAAHSCQQQPPRRKHSPKNSDFA